MDGTDRFVHDKVVGQWMGQITLSIQSYWDGQIALIVTKLLVSGWGRLLVSGLDRLLDHDKIIGQWLDRLLVSGWTDCFVYWLSLIHI